MIEIHVHIETEGLENRLEAKAEQFKGELNRFHVRLLEIAQRRVRDKAPQRDTRHLKRSIDYKKTGHTGYVFVDKTIAPYADWVLDGRRGFCAKKAQALKFSIGGKTIFRRCVGPAKSQPFFDEAYPYIDQDVGREADRFNEWLKNI
jgi:hypothetical protein